MISQSFKLKPDLFGFVGTRPAFLGTSNKKGGNHANNKGVFP